MSNNHKGWCVEKWLAADEDDAPRGWQQVSITFEDRGAANKELTRRIDNDKVNEYRVYGVIK